MNDFTKMSLNVRCLIVAIILSALSYASYPFIVATDASTIVYGLICVTSGVFAFVFWGVTFARLIHKFLFGRDWEIPE